MILGDTLVRRTLFVVWKRSTSPLWVALALALTGAAAVSAATGRVPGFSLDPRLAAHDFTSRTSVQVIVRLDSQVETNRSPESTSKEIVDQLAPIIDQLQRSTGVTHVRPLRLQKSFAADVDAEGFEELQSLPGLLSIEIDDRWSLHTAEGMEMIGASDLQTYGFSGAGSAVAIIDTGIDPLHPALGGGLIPNPKVVLGLDTADGDTDPSDCSGHGTAVASIAAGVSVQWSPGRRFAGGVAPEARILAYKAVSDDNCWSMQESAVIAAIEDAVLHRTGDDYVLTSINISGGGGTWSGPCDSDNPALAEAVDTATSAGIAVVASTGNDGWRNGVASPACIENVLAVGSVWDQNPSPTGSLFCLNADCSRFCSDEGKLAGQPTCYGNLGLMLDLLAPSEYLLVAEAGGQTTAFGGTSGAAPYVTGSLAILRQAHPNVPPAHLRHILRASSTLLTDPEGHRTFPLTDLRSAVSPEGLYLGNAINTTIPSPDSSPEISQAFVDSWGPVGSVDVALRITHPRPELLVIRLRNPLAQEILIHDETAPLTSESALIGTFPLDLEPVESLNALIGSERHGTWELEIEDRMAEPHSSQLESWSLRIHDLKPPSQERSPNMTFLPVVARGPGASGTRWSTDLQIFNPSSFTAARGSLYLVEENSNGSESFLQRPLFIPAGAQLKLIDVVGETFGLPTGAGQMLIATPVSPLIAGGTIATQAASGGTFGQFEHGVEAMSGTSLVLPHISGGADFRTNIGLSENIGTTATATLSLFDTLSGAPMGHPVELEIQPFSITRIDGILEAAGAPDDAQEAFAVIETTDMVSAWASVVDESTGDATFVLGAEPQTGSGFMIPVVANTSGVADTQWRSDVRIVTIDEASSSLLLEYRPLGSPYEQPVTAELIVEGGSGAVLTDIVDQVFGLPESAGSLRIVAEPEGAALAISSRTYNQSLDGTFGQSIPAVTSGSRGIVSVIGIEGTIDRRTNLILAEVAGADVTIAATLRNRHGDQLGSSKTLQIAPFGAMQINDVFSEFEVSHQENCRIEIRRVGGNGSFFALASVIDRLTGDAVAISMTETN